MTDPALCHDSHGFVSNDAALIKNKNKTFWVVVLTSATMILEIAAGFATGSMALLADGWHMASHAGALGLGLLSYHLALSPKVKSHLSFGTGKMIPLGGYTSAIILGMIALIMAIESVKRLMNPQEVHFDEALWVALFGLIINIISAFILRDDHHHHHDHHHDENHNHNHDHHHDHNIKSAYVHVIADAFTSVLAITALFCGKYFGLLWMDSLMGIVGACVILFWAYGLCRTAGFELLDGHSKAINPSRLKNELEGLGLKVADIHLWRIAPKAIAGEVVINTAELKGSDYYRKIILDKFPIQHLIIEERLQRL